MDDRQDAEISEQDSHAASTHRRRHIRRSHCNGIWWRYGVRGVVVGLGAGTVAKWLGRPENTTLAAPAGEYGS